LKNGKKKKIGPPSTSILYDMESKCL